MEKSLIVAQGILAVFNGSQVEVALDATGGWSCDEITSLLRDTAEVRVGAQVRVGLGCL